METIQTLQVIITLNLYKHNNKINHNILIFNNNNPNINKRTLILKIKEMKPVNWIQMFKIKVPIPFLSQKINKIKLTKITIFPNKNY